MKIIFTNNNLGFKKFQELLSKDSLVVMEATGYYHYFGIANGLNNTFAEEFVDDAANAVFIRSGTTTKPYKGLQAGRKIQFKNEDYQYIKTDFDENVEFITSRIYKDVAASYKNEKNNYSLRAVHPDHQYLEKTKVYQGRYINQRDMDLKTKVVVIGRLVKEDLFLKTDPIGQYINLSGISYKVVGVFADDGGDNEERLLYMPLTTAQLVYGNNDYVDQINLTYDPKLDFNQAIDFGLDLEKKLKERFFVACKTVRFAAIGCLPYSLVILWGRISKNDLFHRPPIKKVL